MVITFMVGCFDCFSNYSTIYVLPPDAFSVIFIDGIHHDEHFIGNRIISEM